MAIWTQKPQILYSVISRYPVDVVKLQAQGLSPPLPFVPTKLTFLLQKLLFEHPLLDDSTPYNISPHEELLGGNRPALAWSKMTDIKPHMRISSKPNSHDKPLSSQYNATLMVCQLNVARFRFHRVANTSLEGRAPFLFSLWPRARSQILCVQNYFGRPLEILNRPVDVLGIS